MEEKTYTRISHLHSFLTPTLDGCECSALRRRNFVPPGYAPGTYWTGDRVDIRACLEAV